VGVKRDSMADIVGKLWGFCHTLRHDGIDYGDDIEELTYLLFLKMVERGYDRKASCSCEFAGRKATQAILAKAFRGELVPTEVELARREGRSYEAASEFLARVKSERESKASLRKIPLGQGCEKETERS